MANGLAEVKGLLVRRWGELGGYWGISRTMAEIHALLFVTHEPLCTDDIMAALHVSRGNASMNLRGLVDWGLIQRVHKLGDRKEYFQAEGDVWRMFETIMRERRRREMEPIIDTIDHCVETAPPASTGEDAAEFRRRITELRDFLSSMGAMFELVLQFGKDGVAGLTSLMTAAAPDAAGEAAAEKKPSRRSRTK